MLIVLVHLSLIRIVFMLKHLSGTKPFYEEFGCCVSLVNRATDIFCFTSEADSTLCFAIYCNAKNINSNASTHENSFHKSHKHKLFLWDSE